MSNSIFLPLLCLSIIESNIYFYGLLFLYPILSHYSFFYDGAMADFFISKIYFLAIS